MFGVVAQNRQGVIQCGALGNTATQQLQGVRTLADELDEVVCVLREDLGKVQSDIAQLWKWVHASEEKIGDKVHAQMEEWAALVREDIRMEGAPSDADVRLAKMEKLCQELADRVGATE